MLRILYLMLFISLTACGPSERNAFAAYANAQLTAGVGLGDIKLNESSLGEIVARFGSGHPSVLFGDDTVLQLEFMKAEVRFSFFVTGQCQDEAGSTGMRLAIRQGIKKFLKTYPACTSLPLTTLYLTAKGTKPDKTFYKGSTEQGIRLWDRFETLNVLPNPGINIDLLDAEEKPTYMELLESTSLKPGINFYYQGATAEEIRSGGAMTEERLKELSQAQHVPMDQIVVRQFMIYSAERY